MELKSIMWVRISCLPKQWESESEWTTFLLMHLLYLVIKMNCYELLKRPKLQLYIYSLIK